MLNWKLNDDGTCSLFEDDKYIGLIYDSRYAETIVYAMNKCIDEYRQEIAATLKH